MVNSLPHGRLVKMPALKKNNLKKHSLKYNLKMLFKSKWSFITGTLCGNATRKYQVFGKKCYYPGTGSPIPFSDGLCTQPETFLTQPISFVDNFLIRCKSFTYKLKRIAEIGYFWKCLEFCLQIS